MIRTVSNPPNPWSSTEVEWLEEPPPAALSVYEERAKSILSENNSPDVGFRFSVNPYRGCFHGCAYCMSGDTAVLLGDGRTRPLADLRPNDVIYGTQVRGHYRRLVKTRVLAHWSQVKPAYRVTLEDGTELVASGEHRFLTLRGWKHVTGTEHRGASRRPHLTRQSKLMGFGGFAIGPVCSSAYQQGYLCGMIRGDALIGHYEYDGRRRARDRQHHFRLALVDLEALHRTKAYLRDFEVETRNLVFQHAVGARKRVEAIRTHCRIGVERIEELIAWPSMPDDDWYKGFLAGIFDAEGSYSCGVLRISNADPVILHWISTAFERLGFDSVLERSPSKRVCVIRLHGGICAALRFFHKTNPAISRKRNIEGQAIKNSAPRRVTAVERLGVDLQLFDITTGTGDFIANGIVSHNCYARPSHQYLGHGAGTDFERKIVVKVNAPELLERAFRKPSWKGDVIALSGNTDCYQPLEASYGITRQLLQVCLDFQNPVSIITKSALVRRDVDLLRELTEHARCHVSVSIPFADDRLCHQVEPYTAPPSRRFETLRILSDAGISTGVAVAPIIVGLNDTQIPEILERARASGARRAFSICLRLPREVLPVFRERLEQQFPEERVRRVWNAIAEVRGGGTNESAFGARMVGRGPRWQLVEQLFAASCRRLGLDAGESEPDPPTTFRRPTRQQSLF